MRNAVLALGLALVLGACGAQAPLPPKPAEVPAGLDLSGLWTLAEDDRAARREIADAEREAAGGNESLIPKRTRSATRPPRKSKVQVHVFLETGKSLRISQTEHGLFISFDRSVVEEYRFGEHRNVNVGPVEAERVSGWENNAYVIETRDQEGAMLFESYRLDGNDRMIRTIRIVHDDEKQLDVSQVFERS